MRAFIRNHSLFNHLGGGGLSHLHAAAPVLFLLLSVTLTLHRSLLRSLLHL